MSGLPKLPGLSFRDPSIQRFHLCQTFDIINGYRHPKMHFTGHGNSELDINSVAYVSKLEPLHYDPSLTYGRTRAKAPPLYLPHYALYDQKCLTFKAFFKQSVFESPAEYFRVRHVNIIYFLEDDSMTVMEPKTANSGFDQGRLVKRGKIPKTDHGEVWHWKDLNVGIDICIYGIVYHTVDCDKYTKEFMRSQGVIVGETEALPPDPYTQDRKFKTQIHCTTTPPADDKFRRFLEYDGKILKFDAMWDDRDSEYGEIRPYEILYFLADDTVAVKEVMQNNEGRDPFPQLLRKTKLPKIWTERPVNYPSIYLERSDAEVNEYYQPKDFRVGETIFVLGRRMFLYDCDKFTRNYYQKVLRYEQQPAIDMKPKEKPKIKPPMPPHDGFGSLEDSMQNTYMMIPKPPRKDVIKQVTNANKFLRYEMKFDAVHPEDTIRRFVMKYNLGDGTVNIYEIIIENSGVIGGKYLRNTMLTKPGGDPLDPDYYSPADFYIGGVITVYEQRFIIIGADLYVYRYMQENPDKFPCEIIENMRNYMFIQGHLKDDLLDEEQEYDEAVKKAERDAIGRDLEKNATEMEKCLEQMHVGGAEFDPSSDDRKRAQILMEYEKSMEHKEKVPPYGIKPLNKDCAYPLVIGDVKSIECTDMGDQSLFTPKHIDTPEEALQKHYDAILQKHKDVCETGDAPPCDIPPPIGIDIRRKVDSAVSAASPLMVQPVELPKGACRIKSVRFAEGPERCVRDRMDLCDMRTDKIPCDCTDYYQKC
ncbi:PREDICTED: EF-hand domain-containing protein 1-like [Nicrophorus vespilloides]|uniref:EF-hand domain-containing protein 1-like n=1 Tax=Nicrophorus vespilloides TaxID=110193 RepID=A0ABM1MSZ1_NICVS|nr:PREDICTED: EF-hand domain-containing protein 1-like [Nicrophorus vespilloides]